MTGISSRIARGTLPWLIAGLLVHPVLAQQAALPPLAITVIETDPDVQDLPFLAAIQLAPEFNLKIEAVTFNGGGEAGEVFLGGRGDLLLAGGDKVIAMNKRSAGQVKMIGAVMQSGGWSVATLKDSPYNSFTDLKGKNISVTGPGASSEMFVRYGVHQAGLDPNKDISIIALGAPSNLEVALEHKKVEASALAGSYLMFPLQEGKIKLLGNYEQIKYPGDDFIAMSKTLAAHPEIFVRFMTVYRAALKRVRGDHAYAMTLAKSRLTKAGYTDQQLSDLIDHHAKVIWAADDGLVTREQYTNATAIWTGSGRYTNADIPPYEDVVVNSLPGK